MQADPSRLECVFIGDDFTGASDTLATFSRAGWRTRLFLEPPTRAELVEYEAVGIATALRSLRKTEMRADLEKLGAGLAGARARFYHYKICSTFDSSETIGSIGTAVEVLSRHVCPALTVIIGGQPSLGRYCHFGHLFARAADGAVYRIDRHPVMARHPITPMSEADLRLHLARQGLTDIALISGPELEDTVSALTAKFEALAIAPGQTVLLDASRQDHIRKIGEALRSMRADGPVLLVGSSSVAEALGAHGTPVAQADSTLPGNPHSGPVFVFAGSRSSVTADQVEAATDYEKHSLTPETLGEPARLAAFVEALEQRLAANANVLVHLAPDADYGMSGNALARHCARFVATVARDRPLAGLGIAGGDTSSLIVAELGIRSLVHVADADRGVAICAGLSPDRPGPLLLMLKGGQMGGRDLFDRFLAVASMEGLARGRTG